jgi:hypothetical protein
MSNKYWFFVFGICANFLFSILSHAHIVNATRMEIYFSHTGEFVAHVYVDLAQMGITYETYFDLSQSPPEVQNAHIQPLIALVQGFLIFHFDGWPVPVTVRTFQLPRGTQEDFLDERIPKMSKIQFSGRSRPDALIFSMGISESATFEFPILIRIEMPANEMPMAVLIGEPGERSRPVELALDNSDGYRPADAVLSFVIAFGEGMLRMKSFIFPHHFEILAVLILPIFLGRRMVVIIFFYAFILLGLMGGLFFDGAYRTLISPHTATGALLLLVIGWAIRSQYSNSRIGFSFIGLSAPLAGFGFWQIVPSNNDFGYEQGYFFACLFIMVCFLLMVISVRGFFKNLKKSGPFCLEWPA